jgi:aerobic-type carbon monoxide dehydrogenase small subunit (CoxS/CutS family)
LVTESLTFRVNGASRTVETEPWTPVLEVLRDRLGLTGTKEGCAVGVCGLCSVTVDTELVSACLVPVAAVCGRDVGTVEGLANEDRLSALQDQFIEHGGFQCGICTPGQLVAATCLLDENPSPTEEEIRDWLGGNLCRCTGYQQIVEAITAAAAVAGAGSWVE